MDRAKVRRTTAIAAVSILFNLVLLLGLTVGVPWSDRARSLDQPDVVVSLLHPPPPAPKPAASNKPVERPRQSSLAPHSPAPIPLPNPPPAINLPPNPPVDAGAQAAMGNLVKALRGSVGCSHPDAANLTEAEREACRRRLHAEGENVKPLLGLTEEKRNRFERAGRCRREYYDAPVPQGNSKHNEPNDLVGLGQTPRLRDCPPSDQ